MKTLSPSGKISFVVVAIVAVTAVLILRTFAQSSSPSRVTDECTNWAFCVTINATSQADHFLPLKKSKEMFDCALCNLMNKGKPDINFKANPTATETPHYKPDCSKSLNGSVKTDKVTKSDLADSAAVGESAANDPNVVTHLYSNDSGDIAAVLETFR